MVVDHYVLLSLCLVFFHPTIYFILSSLTLNSIGTVAFSKCVKMFFTSPVDCAIASTSSAKASLISAPIAVISVVRTGIACLIAYWTELGRVVLLFVQKFHLRTFLWPPQLFWEILNSTIAAHSALPFIESMACRKSMNIWWMSLIIPNVSLAADLPTLKPHCYTPIVSSLYGDNLFYRIILIVLGY